MVTEAEMAIAEALDHQNNTNISIEVMEFLNDAENPLTEEELTDDGIINLVQQVHIGDNIVEIHSDREESAALITLSCAKSSINTLLQFVQQPSSEKFTKSGDTEYFEDLLQCILLTSK